MVYRGLCIISIIVTASVSSGAAIGAPVAVTLCVDDVRNVRDRASKELQKRLADISIALVKDPRCRAGAKTDHRYVGWFESRGGRIYLAVRKGKGKTLRRLLPWLTREDSCLARIAARGKLAELSVILQGLVLEHSLGLLAIYPNQKTQQKTNQKTNQKTRHEPIPTQKVSPKVAAKRAPLPVAADLDSAPAPAPAPAPAHRLPRLASPNNEPAVTPPAEARKEPAAPPPAEARKEPDETERSTSTVEAQASRRPVPAKPERPDEPGIETPKLAATPPERVATTPERVATPPERVATTPMRVATTPERVAIPLERVATTPKRVATTPERVPPAEAVSKQEALPEALQEALQEALPEALPEPSRPTVRRSLHPSSPWLRLQDFSVHSHLSGRWRSSDLWSVEAGGSLGWRSLVLRAGYQLPAQWSFEGRPVEATAIPLLAGWRPTVWKRSSLRLRGLAGAAVERIALRRQDVEGATWHSFWDVGLTVGAASVHDLAGGLKIAVLAEGTWFFAGQQVEIRDGPKTMFNQLGAKVAIQVSFGGDG